MRRLAALTAPLAAVLAALAGTLPPASAAVQTLMPAVTYQREAIFTLRGPVVVHALTIPRPGGLWTLEPVLANEAVPGLERLTEMQARLGGTAVLAGINGDLFNRTSGAPNGILMRDGALDHTPLRARTSAGIDASGNLRADRVGLLGTWQGTGPRRPFGLVNDGVSANAVSLFTPAYGQATPPQPGTVEVTLHPFPRATPGTPLTGSVVAVGGGGNTPIPPDGAVLVARGTAATRLQAEAPLGAGVTVRLILSPDWSGVVDAIGGGPLLVRNRVADFDAGELFDTGQLVPRSARSAIGQLADGRLLLVAVDGGPAGFSIGMTNFELAQTMVRLGAVTAVAMDSSTAAMAFDGKLLTQPPAGGEPPVADALLVGYSGVYAPPATEHQLSPNGDGTSDTEQLSYRLLRPSQVTAQLLGPDGKPRYQFSGHQDPGTVPFVWNGLRADGAPEAEGRWQWYVQATDDRGVASSINRRFTLNLTLGAPQAVPPLLAVPRPAARTVATFQLGRSATVTARIETTAGAVVRTLFRRPSPAGTLEVQWDGLADGGAVVYTGRYVARVSAANQLGTVDLSVPFGVRRAAGTGLNAPPAEKR